MARLLSSFKPPERRIVAEPNPIPDELADWFVDDWVRSDDPVDTALAGAYPPSGPTPGDLNQARILMSRQRFLRARARWAGELADTGSTPPLLPQPGPPQWRRPWKIGR